MPLANFRAANTVFALILVAKRPNEILRDFLTRLRPLPAKNRRSAHHISSTRSCRQEGNLEKDLNSLGCVPDVNLRK